MLTVRYWHAFLESQFVEVVDNQAAGSLTSRACLLGLINIRETWGNSIAHPDDDGPMTFAEVAELVDALASGASGGNPVEVQVLSSAPFP